jgi:uncharacterized protein YggE
MRIRTKAGLVFSALLFAAAAAGQAAREAPRSISVRGHGSVTVEPDAATVSFGMFVRERDVQAGKRRCDAILGALLKLAGNLGIPEKSMRTSALLVTPRDSSGPEPQFLGYDVTRELTLELADLGKLDRLVDGAVAAGANRDFNIALRTTKEASLQREALGKAIEDAKERAAFAAGRLEARVGPVRTISLDQGVGPISPVAVRYSALNAGGQGNFLPGTITVDVQIELVFSLEGPEGH